MSAASLPTRVAAARELLEGIPNEHDDLRAEQLANLMEALEFLGRLEDSFNHERADD